MIAELKRPRRRFQSASVAKPRSRRAFTGRRSTRTQRKGPPPPHPSRINLKSLLAHTSARTSHLDRRRYILIPVPFSDRSFPRPVDELEQPQRVALGRGECQADIFDRVT
jgi:hypothetical protein